MLRTTRIGYPCKIGFASDDETQYFLISIIPLSTNSTQIDQVNLFRVDHKGNPKALNQISKLDLQFKLESMFMVLGHESHFDAWRAQYFRGTTGDIYGRNIFLAPPLGQQLTPRLPSFNR